MKRISWLVLGLLLGACSSDKPLAPSPDLAGSYVLFGYSVPELPAPILTGSGTLVLKADSTFTLATHGLAGWDAVHSGTWSMAGNRITLKPEGFAGDWRNEAINIEGRPCQNPASGTCYPFIEFHKQ